MSFYIFMDQMNTNRHIRVRKMVRLAVEEAYHHKGITDGDEMLNIDLERGDQRLRNVKETLRKRIAESEERVIYHKSRLSILVLWWELPPEGIPDTQDTRRDKTGLSLRDRIFVSWEDMEKFLAEEMKAGRIYDIVGILESHWSEEVKKHELAGRN